MSATAAERAQIIAGLRELADLLEASPGLPVPKYPTIRVDAGAVDLGLDEQDEAAKRAAVDAAAAILGRPIEEHHGHYDTEWHACGEDPYGRWRVKYEVGSIAAATMAEYDLRRSYTGNIQVTA